MGKNAALAEIEAEVQKLKALAKDMQIPIDGMVLRYDSFLPAKCASFLNIRFPQSGLSQWSVSISLPLSPPYDWQDGRPCAE